MNETTSNTDRLLFLRRQLRSAQVKQSLLRGVKNTLKDLSPELGLTPETNADLTAKIAALWERLEKEINHLNTCINDNE